MPTVVGVVFSRPGKLYHFNSGDLDLAIDDKVIVKTEHGADLATVLEAPKEVAEEELRAPLKPVLHRATKSELEKAEEYALQAPEALKKAKEKISKRRMAMKVISAEYSYDGRKLTFYFNSEDRVDFRDLVKELSSELKVRVDMRQIGVRDAARCVDGCGPCGQRLCCARHLTDFPPISVRMAKDQDLPLNPGKISGMCGRLLCCLRYEQDNYKDFKKRCPNRGTLIKTEERGEVMVRDFKPMKEAVVVELQSGEREEMRLMDSGELVPVIKKIEESPFPDLMLGDEPPRRDKQPSGGQRSGGQRSGGQRGGGGQRSGGGQRGQRGGGQNKGPRAERGDQPQRTEGEGAASPDGSPKPKRRRRRNRNRKKKTEG